MKRKRKWDVEEREEKSGNEEERVEERNRTRGMDVGDRDAEKLIQR